MCVCVCERERERERERFGSWVIYREVDQIRRKGKIFRIEFKGFLDWTN